ncbi:MAG TPA: ABC transporter substrate binding protein, partial [Candidatus Brocadiia bacterium]|nr:ABC transporter substrate binding protein [Candidatus Brocadiia bacterium]
MDERPAWRAGRDSTAKEANSVRQATSSPRRRRTRTAPRPPTRVFLLLAALLAIAPLAQAASSIPRRVFILHSYALDFDWTRDVQRGIESVLDGCEDIETCVEFMDTKRRCGAEDFERLRQLYLLKHGDVHFDAVLCSDNDALAFLMAHGREIFKNAPIVFCGVNDFRDSMIAGRDDVTGVVEEPDIAGTLELAFKLHPAARQVHVILDQTATGKAHEAQFRRAAVSHAGRAEFLYTTNATAAELRQILSSASPSGFIFYLSFWIDRAGKAHTTRDIVRLVTGSSRLPVYTCWQTFVERGFLGGHVISGQAQGRAAARMAVQILAGAPPASLPVIRKSPNVYVFNGEVMRRLGLSASSLPPGSVIVRGRATFYERHARLIWAAGIFIFGQTGLVIVLFINRALRRNALRQLSGANRFLQTLLDTIPSPVFYRDARGLLAGCNQAFAALIAGKPRDAIIGQPMTQVLAAAPASVVASILSGGGDSRPEGQFTTEVAFPVPGGQDRHYLLGQATCRDAQGQTAGCVTVLADITERRRAEEERRKLEARIQQTQKLESLGVLAGGIAHDFNNLLMGVLGYASVALSELSPVAPARHSVEQIERTAQRAAELIRQMLAYSGKGKFTIEVLDISELVEEMAHLLQVSISKKAVLKLNLARGLPPIEADATQVRQVIMNLITNASEAIGDKSSVISITTGAMHCDRAYLKESYLD